MAKKRAVLSRLVDRFFAGKTLYPVIPIMGTVRNKVLPSRARELYAGLTQCRVSTHILNGNPVGDVVIERIDIADYTQKEAAALKGTRGRQSLPLNFQTYRVNLLPA